MRHTVRVAVLVTLAACAHAPPRPAEPGIAPRPFTWQQIRDAMPTGTELHLRFEAAGEPAVIKYWVVTAANATSCTIASTIHGEDGALVKDEGATTSEWTELHKHATFPAAATQQSYGVVDVPAGHFETVDYVVTDSGPDGVPTVTTYRFARKLPGPPVLMTVERGGTVVRKMTLLLRK